MFIGNTLGGYSPVVLPVLFGKRMLLASFLWEFTVGVEFLDALVAGVSLPGRAWMGMHLRLLEHAEVMPFAVAKVGADDLVRLLVYDDLALEGMSFFLA